MSDLLKIQVFAAFILGLVVAGANWAIDSLQDVQSAINLSWIGQSSFPNIGSSHIRYSFW